MFDYSDEMFSLSMEKNLDEEVEKLFRFYRENGYPDYERKDRELVKLVDYVRKLPIERIYDADSKTILKNQQGMGVLWTYFPHWKEIRCGNGKSLAELWGDDELLRKLIRKTYVWMCKHHEPHWTSNRIRQISKVFLAGQSVSNFRPSAARVIYDRYAPEDGRVLDMSAGFGGRLTGFYASHCSEYVGTEPSTRTYAGLIGMMDDVLRGTELGKVKTAFLINQGSEIPLPYEGMRERYFDLAFTSPPYFDTEKYSDEPTQSYIKYPTLDEWINGFLLDTLKNSSNAVKDDGYVIINIANTNLIPDMEERFMGILPSVGLYVEDVLRLELSSVSGKSRKYEPVFVMKKKNENKPVALNTDLCYNNDMKIKIQKIDERAVTPKYAHPSEDACFDLSVIVDKDKMCPLMYGHNEFFADHTKVDCYGDGEDNIIIEPHETYMFHTGLKFEIEKGYAMKIFVRSSTGIKRNLVLANGTGVIDSNYRGEVMIALTNISNSPSPVFNGDRIAQAEITKVIEAEFEEVNELSDTSRGECGFGSTGAK